MHLSKSIHYDSDSITTRETPGSGGGQGSTQISNAAATQLTAADTECKEVTVQNKAGQSPIAVGFVGLTGVANTTVVLIGGASQTFEVDNVNLIYGYATVNNERLQYNYITRA
jgi:hypothetical protein